jgi:hypothetical protein
MDRIRARIVAVGFAVAILMGLFPPWSVSGTGGSYPGVVFSMGYHPIFLAPLMGEIAVGRLFIQWIVVAIVATAAMYFSSFFEQSARWLRESVSTRIAMALQAHRDRGKAREGSPPEGRDA